jgi:hypothetical protein
MEILPSTNDNDRLTFHGDGTATVVRYSPLTRTFNKAIMKITKEQYEKWHNNRMLIQDALPHLDREEREFLMTGYTPADWLAIFPPEQDEGE